MLKPIEKKQYGTTLNKTTVSAKSKKQALILIRTLCEMRGEALPTFEDVYEITKP